MWPELDLIVLPVDLEFARYPKIMAPVKFVSSLFLKFSKVTEAAASLEF